MKPTPEQIALARRVPYSSSAIAEAIAAAEERGRMAERAAVIEYLCSRRDETYTPPIPVHDLVWCSVAIEAGDHHEVKP